MRPGLNVVPFDPSRDNALGDSLGDLANPVLLSVLNASPDCIKIIELDGSISFMNHNGRHAMEVDDFVAVDGAQWCALWPEATQPVIADAVESARVGTAVRLESFCPTAKGTPRWWDVSVAPVFDKAGEVRRILSISRDITAQMDRENRLRDHEAQLAAIACQQEAALQEKQRLLDAQSTLMREIDHRVKNSLTMISSLLRTQARGVDDERARQELSDAANRVLTVGKVHERLYHDEHIGTVSLDEYLEPLCTELVEAVANEQIVLETRIEPIKVSADDAVALGLIASELLANAIRHAFGDGTGTVVVSTGYDGDARRVLRVRDNGTGLDTGFDLDDQPGLGMKIMKLYARQLNATLEADTQADGGSVFTLVF